MEEKAGWPALFQAISSGKASLVLEFGGQGISYFSELKTIVEENPCVAGLFERVAADLALLGSREHVHCGLGNGFELAAWMKSPPPIGFLEQAPISFPLIGLTQMLMYYTTLKRAGVNPAQAQELCSGALGHSSGVCAATVAAASTSFDHLENLIIDCVHYLFWHGVRCQQETPIHTVDPSLSKNGEKISPMLNVRGVPVKLVQKAVDTYNKSLTSEQDKLKESITIGLINGSDTTVIVGTVETVHKFAVAFQQEFPKAQDSQSAMPCSKRRYSYTLEYLKVTTPCHSLLITKAVPKIVEDASVSSPLLSALSGKDLAFPVFSTVDGSDLRESKGALLPLLVKMQVQETLDWRKATSSIGRTPTFIADFGPGGKRGVAAISSRYLNGRAVSFAHASPNGQGNSLYPNAELLVQVDAKITVPISWEDEYAPRMTPVGVAQDAVVDTSWSKLLDAPLRHVAASNNTDYRSKHAEVGIPLPHLFEKEIRDLAEIMPQGKGISCNLLFLNPCLWGFRSPLFEKLYLKSERTDSITIAADFPIHDEAKEIADPHNRSGMRYLSFKPGSADAILQVLELAKAHPEFYVVIQFTGGAWPDGHSSLDDQYEPLLKTYAQIRSQKNVILVIDGSQGDADYCWDFLSGEWSLQFDYPKMPCDGALYGSRMVACKDVATGATAKDSWFCRGDLATISHTGYLQVVGSLKDMVLVGSENVYCAEVENVLCTRPAFALSETSTSAILPEASGAWKAQDIQRLVLNTIAGLLGCNADEVPLREAFATFGLTSKMSVDMSIRLGQALSCKLPATLAFDFVSVQHLCEYLHTCLHPCHDVESVEGAALPGEGDLSMDLPNVPHSPAELQIDGVACVLPGGKAGSLGNWKELWEILLQGQDCVSEPPPGRPTAAARKLHPCQQAGYLNAEVLMMFDAASFSMNVAEAKIMDPQQRLCLRVAREALEDGHCSMKAPSAVGVFVGVTTVDFASLVKANSQQMTPSAYTGTSLTTAICANRISYAFDLRGPSMAIDSACSSSVVTTDLAFMALRSGRCKSALSMGVNVQMDPFWTEAFASAEMLSASGRCRFGDDAADGYVRGEGCAGLLLSTGRREDAVLPDPYATLASVAVNQDGRSNGLTAPNPSAQRNLLQQAWQEAEFTESSAAYIEAHGSGTFLGDPIEITAMGSALRASKSCEIPVLQTASLKSNIGHLECGAGAASSLKLALILQQSVVPVSLHFHVPNRNVDWSASNVTIVSEIGQLTADGAAQHRLPCGGVSGFGFGGTNGHVVMQAHKPKCMHSSQSTRLPPRRLSPILCWPDVTAQETGCDHAVALQEKRPVLLCSTKEKQPTSQTQSTPHTSVSTEADLRAEIRRLHAQVAELTAKLASKEECIQKLEQSAICFHCRASNSQYFPGSPPSSVTRHEAAAHDAGGEDALTAEEDFENKFGGIVIQAVHDIMPSLSMDPLHLDTDLIELGLDSLSAIELSHRLRSALPIGTHISGSQLLKEPTMRAMFKLVGRLANRSTSIPLEIENLVEDSKDFPASALQRGMLFHQMSSERADMFLETICLEVNGPLDVAAFRSAWARVLSLVPQLRARFDAFASGRAMQSVMASDICKDISKVFFVHEMWNSGIDEVHEFISRDRMRGMRIDEAPLLRVSLLLLQAEFSYVVVTIHHLIIDGWSWRVVVEILQHEYETMLAQGRPSVSRMEHTIPSLSSIVHYEDSNDSSTAKRYWSTMLQGAPSIQPRARTDYNYDVLRRFFKLDVTEGARVRAFASRCGVTIAAVLHAAWYLVYSSSSFCGADDVIFGYTASRRTMPVPGIQQIVGPIVNTLPARINAGGSTEIKTFVQDVHQLLLSNADHEWLPLSFIQEASDSRFFDVIVDVQQDNGYSCSLGSKTTMQHKELIDCVGTPLSIRFVLNHDGCISCSAVSESSQFNSEILDATLSGIQAAMAALSAERTTTVASLRKTVVHKMGLIKLAPTEQCELFPPELPLFAVAGPPHVLRVQGSMPDCHLRKADALNAFAAALDQWSSGPSCFLIWAWCNSESYEWVRTAVDRTARAGVNTVSRSTQQGCCGDARPVAAFSHGRDLNSRLVGRHAHRLFCFNAAGSSAAQFAVFSQELQSHGVVEAVAVELPGHGARRNEEVLKTMEDIVNLVMSEHGDSMAAAHASGGYTLLGASFGALVAFEVACRMTQRGLPPTQLFIASQAAPSCAAIDLDLNMQDDDVVRALESRGWLSSEFAQSEASVWRTVLPVMRADLAVERSYLLKMQHQSSKGPPLSCQVRVFVGSEDTSLVNDIDRALRPWHDFTQGVTTQCIIPGVGHGFFDAVSGRAAIEQILLEDRPGCSPVAVHLCIDGDQWALLGDDGLVPAPVLNGLAGSFADMLAEIYAGGSRSVQEVLPCNWRAEPMSKPTSLPTQLLHDAFVERWAQTSKHAIIDVGALGEARNLTYSSVEEMSGQVDRKLMSLGVQCQDRVALVSSKGWSQLIGAIGILRSGAAYLPIDPKQVPRERAEMLLKLAGVSAVVVDKRSLSECHWVSEVQLPMVVSGCCDKRPEAVLVSLSDVRSRCKPEESAYILYTSGSTGVPKGVNCHHLGAVNTCLDLNRRFGISAADRALALSSFSFDLSVYDVFGMAIAGGTVVLPQPETISPPDPASWIETANRESVTLINAVPAFLELLVGHCETTGTKLPKSLRLVWMSGDWVPLSLPRRILASAEGQVTVVALGGATEAAIWSNMYVVPEQLPSGWKSIPYGRPLGNQSMYVLNEGSKLLEHTAPWVTGMIYIGGAGVALGYLGDEVKTAASFVIHPVSGERIYRTGDLGRLRPGESEEFLIEILGREDSQVKLNGFRIELGEVEAEVSAFDAVEESCASVIHAGSGPFLAAFFRGAELEVAELQQRLAQRLPSQLVPKVLLRVDGRFPLNSNGKVDRKKLAELHADVLATLGAASKVTVPPVGDSELRITEAVAEVLSVSSKDICVETNVFSMGLNSLGSMRLAAATLTRGIQLSVRDIFAHPTIRAMAKIRTMHPSDGTLQNLASGVIFKIANAADESCTPFPLIGITKAYWTGLWSNPYCPAGCKPQIAFEFEWEAGRIDVERLERCFDEFVQRNATFRAVVMRESPSMRYLKAEEVTPIKFKVFEVQDEEDVKTHCDQAYRDIFDNVIDPFTFPLLQGCVVHLPKGRSSRFYYCVSLFAMDGITDLTWRSHISKLYQGEALPAPPCLTYKAYNESYADEVTGIRKAARWQAARDFWMRRIDAGLPPPPQLPIVKESPANRGTFSDRGTVTIRAEHLQNIKAAAARFGVTPTAILLMLYCVCLSRHAASSKMLINVLHCLRHPVHDDCHRVLGNFSSSFLCPIDVSLGVPSHRSLLMLTRAVMDALFECQANNTISGVDVMSLINTKQAALGKAAAPYVFVSALGLEDSLPDWKSLCFREMRVVESTSGTYMVHAIKEYPDGSMLSSFNTVDGAFDSATIEALVSDHQCLLEAISMHGNVDSIWHRCPNDILGELPVPLSLGSLSAADPTEFLHSQLAKHAAYMSSQIAIVDAGTGFQLSYREYLDAAKSVVLCLDACGATDGFGRYGAPLVSVACEKSWQQILAVLGVVCANCAYLPINVAAWPRSRIEAVLEAGEVVAVVSSDRTLACLPWLAELHQPVVSVDQATSGAAAVFDDLNIPRQTSSDAIAYCIFTSGSTGRPKGVAMAHKAALNTIRALIDLHKLGSDTTVLGLSQLSFDLSVADIFLTLRIGGTLVVPPDSSLSPPSPAQWRSMCAKHGVTLWNSVPALFGLLCEEAKHAGQLLPQSLQRIWLSGDVISENLPASARAVACQQLQIFAMGGATEAGIWSNSADISNHHPSDGAVPYGNALPGQGMKVVRIEDLTTAAVGVSGMLAISGDSLMMGYYNDKQTTSKALVEVNGEQLYLTQDAGYTRCRSDGSLECMITGRIHGEDGGYVKVRGFRVELHELEVVLRSHVAVKAAVVALHQGDLASYVVLNCEADVSSVDDLKQELRRAMVASLPIYALPRWIQVLDALPLSSNGKVDRAALPIPIDSTVHWAEHQDAPNEVEGSVLAAAKELGIPVTCRSDNIFSVGADSVAGLRLIFKLESAHNVRIDIGRLFNDGRISSIAAAIVDLASSVDIPEKDAALSLATLCGPRAAVLKGERLPLFLCHGAGTTALALSALAAELQKAGVFGHIHGISDSYLTSTTDRFNFGSIEEVATCMADLILAALQAEGTAPYGEVALGGWSYGAVVAFACARILESRGLAVRLVLLLDAPMGQKDGSQLDEKARAELVTSASSEVADRIAKHFEACNNLLSQFVPLCGEAIKAQVLDIRPIRSQVDFLSDSDRKTLAQSWHRIAVDGADHFTLMQPPFVKDVAKCVLRVLPSES